MVGVQVDDSDPNANTSRALNAGLPLMLGWFSLNVPSGLALYYFSNTVLSLAQQLYLKKLGGAEVGWALAVTRGKTIMRLAVHRRSDRHTHIATRGALQIKVKDLGPVTKPGSGRRSGPAADGFVRWESKVAAEVAAAKAKELAADDDEDGGAAQQQQQAMADAVVSATAAAGADGPVASSSAPAGRKQYLVKRKKLELVLRA